MVEMSGVYQGDFHCELSHAPSGAKISTDAPKDNMGRGEAFSPTDLVATALGACMTTIMAIVAERHKIDLKGMKITVKKHMIDKPVRRIAKLEVHFRIPNVEKKYRILLEKAAKTCPVHQSLHPDVEKDIRFEWWEG